MGEDWVALGTDYPFPLGELQPGKLIKDMDDLSSELKDKLLADNALRFLNRKREDFL